MGRAWRYFVLSMNFDSLSLFDEGLYMAMIPLNATASVNLLMHCMDPLLEQLLGLHIVENSVYNTKVNASLNYKISDDVDLSYDMKGDGIIHQCWNWEVLE